MRVGFNSVSFLFYRTRFRIRFRIDAAGIPSIYSTATMIRDKTLTYNCFFYVSTSSLRSPSSWMEDVEVYDGAARRLTVTLTCNSWRTHCQRDNQPACILMYAETTSHMVSDRKRRRKCFGFRHNWCPSGSGHLGTGCGRHCCTCFGVHHCWCSRRRSSTCDGRGCDPYCCRRHFLETLQIHWQSRRRIARFACREELESAWAGTRKSQGGHCQERHAKPC